MMLGLPLLSEETSFTKLKTIQLGLCCPVRLLREAEEEHSNLIQWKSTKFFFKGYRDDSSSSWQLIMVKYLSLQNSTELH